ncbi:cobalt ABC transporter permease, partial [Helicobacter pylori]
MPPTNTLISLIFLWIFNLFWYNNYCIYVFMYLCIYVFMYLFI